MYEKYTSGRITLYTAAKARSAACDLDRIAASAFGIDFPDSALLHELVQNIELGKPLDIELDSELEDVACTCAIKIAISLKNAFSMSDAEQEAELERCSKLHPLAALIVAHLPWFSK